MKSMFKSFAFAAHRLWVPAWYAIRARIIGLPIYRTERIADEPEIGAIGRIYLVADAGRCWAAVMACPGGCGQMLHMNLLPDVHPVWRLTEHADGSASLFPSVWLRNGCGCHFFVRHGRIDWVR